MNPGFRKAVEDRMRSVPTGEAMGASVFLGTAAASRSAKRKGEMDKKYFGTDGVRGVANRGHLRPSVILRLSQALGEVLKKQRGGAAGRVGIAGDSRISQDMIGASLAAGLTSLGSDVIDFGVMPTPALAFLTRSRGLSMGIMVSASHNAMEDNGIKVFDGDGFKLPDEVEFEVEALLENGFEPELPLGAGLGRVVRDPSGLEDYVAHLMGFMQGVSLGGIRIAVDCANGAASVAAPEVLARLGAKVAVTANDPDGTNINRECGSTHPDHLARLVKTAGCDLGVALDGDSDRAIFADPTGRILNGDHVMAFLARFMKERGDLPGNTLVATVMSNLGLEVSLREEGIVMDRTPVGDRHVTARLREGGFGLGGEQSGHLIFGAENHYTGDGIFSALKVLRVIGETGRSLDELGGVMTDFPQVLINVEVASKPPLEKLPTVRDRITEVEQALGDEGRVITRYSGTERLARVMVEGRDESEVEGLARSIAEAIKDEIGTGEIDAGETGTGETGIGEIDE